MFKKKVKSEYVPTLKKMYYMITRCELCGTRYEKVYGWENQTIPRQVHHCANGNIGWQTLVGFVDECNFEEYLKNNNAYVEGVKSNVEL